MRYEKYELEIGESLRIFEFTSEGPKGSIKKRVHYQKVGPPNFYNLAFGDVNLITDAIDDTIVTDNKDTEKILATIASTIYAFIDRYPEARIHLKGSTFTRTRLYRIAISNNLEEISETFNVYGVLDDNKLAVYTQNKNYSAFLITKK
jgi:hypothetical protein